MVAGTSACQRSIPIRPAARAPGVRRRSTIGSTTLGHGCPDSNSLAAAACKLDGGIRVISFRLAVQVSSVAARPEQQRHGADLCLCLWSSIRYVLMKYGLLFVFLLAGCQGVVCGVSAVRNSQSHERFTGLSEQHQMGHSRQYGRHATATASRFALSARNGISLL